MNKRFIYSTVENGRQQASVSLSLSWNSLCHVTASIINTLKIICLSPVKQPRACWRLMAGYYTAGSAQFMINMACRHRRRLHGWFGAWASVGKIMWVL